MRTALAAASLLAALLPECGALAAQGAPVPVPVLVTPIPIPPPAQAPATVAPTQTPAAPPPGATPATQAPASSAEAPTPPPPPEPWVARTAVSLIVLNKISAQTTPVSGAVGATLRVGSLSIVARACVVRPADLPADSAAFLDITDSKLAVPPFHAWILQNEPEVSIYDNPVYSVYLAGCGGGP